MKLEYLFNIIGLVSSLFSKSSGNSTVDKVADIAGDLVSIVQAANQAHIDLTGQPIDPDKLKPFVPLV